MIIPKYKIGEGVYFVISRKMEEEKWEILSQGTIYSIEIYQDNKVEYRVGKIPQDRYLIPEDRIFLTETDALNFINIRGVE